MLNYVKNMFRRDKDVPSTEQFYTPLRIALHSTLALNSVDMVTLIGALHPLFVQPTGDLEVLAIGKFEMDGIPVHRIYVQDTAEEEFIIQLVEGKDHRSGEPTVDELTLYKQVVTLEPETQASLQRALNDIGFTTIQVDEIEYDRFWGDQYTEKMDFRKFTESLVTPQDGTQRFVNNYILYGRTIRGITGDDVNEYLLVGLEEDDDQAQIMMQLGLQLNINDVKVQ